MTHESATAPTARRFRAVNWRQEYLHLAVLLMTASWLAGWVALTLNWFLQISLATALGLTVAHLLSSTLVVRWLLHRRTDLNTILSTVFLLMGIAAGITALLLPTLAQAYGNGDQLVLRDLFHVDRHTRVPAGPLAVLWVLYLWWRGYRMGLVYMTQTRANFGMRLGLLSFVWIALLSGPTLRQDALALLPAFFFFGLLGSGLARADSLHLDRARSNNPLGRGWYPSLITIALLLTAGGYVAALWLSGMDTREVNEVLRTIAEGIVTVVFVIASPLLLVGQLVYDALQRVMPDRLSRSYEASGSGGEQDGGGIQAPWMSDVFDLFSDALVAVALIFIALAVFAFVWFLFIAHSRERVHDDEERETLGTGEVVGGLRQTLREGWRRLAEMLGVLRQFGVGRNLFAALTIRRIYARMEKLAGSRGYPRAAAETPYEYRHTLREAFPDHPAAVQRITEAYVAVRYGDIPEDPAELDAVRAAWEQLQASHIPNA